MNRHKIFVLATVLVSASVLWADSWAKPTPRVFASKYGLHGFKVLNPKFGGPSQGVLFTLDAEGKEKVIWQAKLVNTPHQAIVPDGGKFVVTIDTYGTLGFAHSLVIYGDKGKVIRDFQLEDFLAKDEIDKNVMRTVSSRHWSGKADFRLAGNNLVIRLAWGKTVTVELATGKVKEK